MIRLAVRNLFQNKIRLATSIGGVALALMLILTLDAIFAGVERQITAVIDNSRADIIVSQDGVRNLHMASSSIPARLENRVRSVPGVRSVTAIAYATNVIDLSGDRQVAYIFGIPEDGQAGGPWKIAAGRKIPQREEVIIDRSLAEKSGLGLNDQVEIFSEEFTIAGLSDGTNTLVNSVAFISLDDFVRLRGSLDNVSFILVQIDPGQSAQAVARRIEARLPNVTVQRREAFASQERQVVKDMSTDVITVMNLIGFLIGLAVMALTTYIATLARWKEFGMLKAIGARNAQLVQNVLAHSLLSVGLGLALGLAFTLLLARIILMSRVDLTLWIQPAALLKTTLLAVAIASLSSFLPVFQISRLDPARVFRGK